MSEYKKDPLQIIYNTANILLSAFIGFLLRTVFQEEGSNKYPYYWALSFSIIILILLAFIYFLLIKRKRIDTIQQLKENHKNELNDIKKWCSICKEENNSIAQGRYFLLNENEHFYQKLIENPKVIGADTILDSELNFTKSINRILNKLCASYTDNLIYEGNKLKSELRFTASYQIVIKENDGVFKLKYCGFSTLDGVPPKSMTMDKRYEKGDRLSGLAWEEQQPIIEDTFDEHPGSNYKGFIPNYSGQSAKYNSMICVPIYSSKAKNNFNVIGVLSLCSYIDNYFGKKGDQRKVIEHSNRIKPYSSCISIMTDIYNTIKENVNCQ